MRGVDLPVVGQGGHKIAEAVGKDGVEGSVVVGSRGEGDLDVDGLVLILTSRAIDLQGNAALGIFLFEFEADATAFEEEAVALKLDAGDVDAGEGEGGGFGWSEDMASAVEAEGVGAIHAAKV